FDQAPRYLFRVSTPQSDGASTDRFCARSRAARHWAYSNGPTKDIFSLHREEAAYALYRHLTWISFDADNLVSWKSSLLFAIQYMIYLHKRGKPNFPKLALREIQLYILDTTVFPKGVFVRDLELIEEFRASNRDLDNFAANVRVRTRETHGDDTFYYGEYLSQGALEIEDRCQMVTADAIITQDLFSLRPEFEESMSGGSDGPGLRLASEVNRLRVRFNDHIQPASLRELAAAQRIAMRFGRRWRVPVAAHLLALQPRGDGDEYILVMFRSPPVRSWLPLSLIRSSLDCTTDASEKVLSTWRWSI
ncbi:hypothetical protein B0T22DRAFT_387339, partial [Podospora appendiculata]